MIYWYLTNLYKPDSRDIFSTDWHVYHIYHPTHLSTHNEWLSTSTAVLTASICWVNRLIIFEIFWAIHVGSKIPSCNLQFRSLGHGSFTSDHKELWQLLENSPMRGAVTTPRLTNWSSWNTPRCKWTASIANLPRMRLSNFVPELEAG